MSAPHNYRTISNHPLSNIQAQTLEDRLIKSLGLPHAMGFAMFDGYITAIVSGPNMITPEQWLPWVYDSLSGIHLPKFESQEQMESTVDLLVQHHNAVVDCLEKRPGHYFPAFDRTVLLKGSSMAGTAWCRGYELAIALDPGPWRPLLNAEPQFLERIFNNDASVKNLIARDVGLIFAWWYKRRTEPMYAGRNEPCPCGSGKRFKHCHGAV
jgi:uncharacterized protein